MICVWRAHIEGQAGAKELLAVSPGSCSPLPREHGGHCVQHALWLARAGAKHFAQRDFFCPSGQFQIWASMHFSITRDPNGYLRLKRNRIPSSASSCNPVQKKLQTQKKSVIVPDLINLPLKNRSTTSEPCVFFASVVY